MFGQIVQERTNTLRSNFDENFRETDVSRQATLVNPMNETGYADQNDDKIRDTEAITQTGDMKKETNDQDQRATEAV